MLEMSAEETATGPTPAGNQPGASPASRPEDWVDHHGDPLFRHALARLRDAALAEDAVQETFLAALKNRREFEGRSSERSWLLGILKHKIADHFRRSAREDATLDPEAVCEAEPDCFTHAGWSRGAWRSDWGPLEWPDDVAGSLDRAAFWQTFWDCVRGVPKQVAAVFLMREMDELSGEAIARELGLNPNHVFVLLHRARMSLRRCLESNWFKQDAKGKAP